MMTARLSIESDRLFLRLGEESDVPEIIRYYWDNREHLAPWEPRRPPDFYTERFWHDQVERNFSEARTDQSLRLFLFERARPERIVGAINFSAFQRGVAHCCNLGYGLAAEAQGRGYMREILPAAIAHVFDERHMHRIQANYIPHNQRSGALLKRLGFVVEGYARDYLLIDGTWQDHVLTSLTNTAWTPR